MIKIDEKKNKSVGVSIIAGIVVIFVLREYLHVGSILIPNTAIYSDQVTPYVRAMLYL